MRKVASAYLAALCSVSAVALVSPACAQSTGGPASGTASMPPATGVNQATSPSTPAVSSAETSQSELGDIIVTARRQNERLQETPVAVTALNNELLLQKQVTNVVDLARAAPALSIGTGGTGPSTIVFLAIRGQAQNSPNSFADASVGIYIDGVYVGRPIVGNLGFLDMGSAEVLRGPQGTLFGRNTVGGALNLTTAAPENDFGGHIKAGIGNYDQRMIEGVLNIPLSSTVTSRFAGRYTEHDGYYPAPFYGRALGGVTGEYYGRGTLKWEPDDLPIVWTVSGEYNRYRDTGNGITATAINPDGPVNQFYNLSQAVQAGLLPGNAPIPLGPGFTVPASTFTNFSLAGSGPLSQYINPKFPGSTATGSWRTAYGFSRTGNPEIDNQHNYNDAHSFTSNLVVELGDISIKSITGYRKSDTENTLSLTGTPTGGGDVVSEYEQHQFSQELQFSGKIDALEYIAGLYYFREAGEERSDSATLYNTPIGSYSRDLSDFRSKSVGMFAQLNYQITDKLRVTGGLRYTWDKRYINRKGVLDWRSSYEDQICSYGDRAGQVQGNIACADQNSVKFSYPAWTANVDYRITPDLFVYAKTSGASMSGGFNSRPSPPPYSDSFKPEKLRDVELGFKGEFLNRRLRTNLALFNSWGDGVQRLQNAVVTLPDGSTRSTQFITNAGKTRIRGAELEASLIPWQGMTIDASAAYLRARYAKGSRIEPQLINGAIVQVDRSGEPITQAPKWTASVGATQAVEFDAGKLIVHADYSYIADRYFDYITSGDPNPAVQAVYATANQSSIVKAYGLVNGQITFVLNNPNIEFAFWGKNLTNKAYFTNAFSLYSSLGTTVQGLGVPRTYGVTASVNF